MSRISYSIDGGTTWLPIEDIAATSETLDFSRLPGAPAALIRIDVSDGINTGSATSVPFNVPKKLPTAIVITSPVTGAVQPASKPVYLSGAAYDPDDGVLAGAALQWSDSVQGNLGTGSPLSVYLQPGSHTITLTATDSDGNVLTATTQVTLGGSAPVVNLTTAQAAGNHCFNATVGASPGNQGADLSIVNYSLTGGSSYTSIPLNSLPFTFPVTGTGTVIVAAVAQDASGRVASQSVELSLGAGCNVNPTQTTPTVTVTPASSSVTAAQPISVAVAVSGVAGNPVPTGSVTLSSGSYISTVTTLANGSATINIPAGSLPVGTDTLTATYTPDSNSASTYSSASGTGSITVNASPSFTLAPSAGTLAVVQGASNTDTITVNPVNGFSGNVTLTASGLPNGVTASFGTNPATASSVLTLTASSTATVGGPTTISITGVSGSVTAITTISLTVNAAPSFTLVPSAPTLSVVQGSNNTDTITVNPANGFTGSVTLVASGLPSGVTVLFGTNPATGSSVLTLTATSTATVGGPATVTITGTSGSLTESTSLALTVSAGPTFVVGDGTSTLSLLPGATTGNTVPITVTPSNGFTGTVNLTCSITPTAASDTPTCTLTPSSIAITGNTAQNSTLTIFTTAESSSRNQWKKLLWPSAGTSLGLLLMIGIPRRRRNLLTMLGVLALVVTFGVIGCGGRGGSSGGGGGGGGNSGTTPGTYTVSVTGTSGNITGTVGTVTLTVQ